MNRPLRILVLADARSFHTERYVRELRNQGCRVVTASLEHGNVLHLHLKRIGPISQLHYFCAVRQVQALIRKFKPDAVNAHFATGYGWVAARAISMQRPPIVLHLWGSDIFQVPHKSLLHRKKAEIALKRAAIVIADSDYLVEEAKKTCPVQAAKVVYWGLERMYLAYSDTRRSFGKPLRIIMPRHHEPIYNNAFALRALAPLLNDRVVTLMVPGWGSLVNQFKALCAELHIEGVQFYDRLPRDQYMQMLSGHDVYLSVSSSDSSPASLIEASGLGLVPVCVDIPGVREWLSDANGYLVKSSDEESLRRAIGRIVESGGSCEVLRAANYERVKREAIFENVVADTIDSLISLLEGAR